MYIQYEGSPNLGYASLGQIVEYTETKMSENDAERLFSVHDPKRVQRIGKKVFQQMARGIGSTFYPKEDNKYVLYHHEDGLGTDVYELGAESDDPELGTLINLDSLNATLEREFGTCDLPLPHYTPQVKPLAEAFLQDRKAFLGMDNRGDL